MPRSLRITSPCPMDWNAMRSAEGGRFCEHCRKTVLDLSDCTEAQALERVGSGPACVRMRVDAAGRPQSEERLPPFPSGVSGLHAIRVTVR